MGSSVTVAPHESGLARRSGFAPSARWLVYCPLAVLSPLAGSDTPLDTLQVVTTDNGLTILLGGHNMIMIILVSGEEGGGGVRVTAGGE